MMTALLVSLALAASLPPIDSSKPNRAPQLAVTGRQVSLVYASGGRILLVQSSDEGKTFGVPREVAQLPALAAGRHRGPRIGAVGGALVVSAIGGPTAASELLVWRSEDGGKTWSTPVTVNDVPASPREGLHAMAIAPDGTIRLVWLDLRTKGMSLYGAHSTDGGKTWSKNELVYESPDGAICTCCHPTILAEAGGPVVMFRNALEGMRDMYLLRAGQPARKLGDGSWKLNACPMDGGGLARLGDKLVSAWRREDTVYLATEGQREVALGLGKDVALAAAGKQLAAVWTQAGQVVSYRGPADGTGKRGVLAPAGAIPSVLALPGGGFLAVWEENGAIGVGRLE